MTKHQEVTHSAALTCSDPLRKICSSEGGGGGADRHTPPVKLTDVQLDMNLALIHDRLHIKTFWENRINTQCLNAENEEQRMNKSALSKLRGEWLIRLENRTKHLKNLNDNYLRKMKVEKTGDQT
ncbi:hypothetical protein INR49_018850 [Caranx melampygus]|nr:hypothetical protein INR49_018850 [Caranx melampygus]